MASLAETLSDEYLLSIAEIENLIGTERVAEVFNLKHDSVRRYISEADRRGLREGLNRKTRLASQLTEQFTQKELSAMLHSGSRGSGRHTYTYDLGGDGRLKFAIFSDPHIGHHCFEESVWDAGIELCHKEGIELALLPGDLTEGMSNRAGHVYELTEIGYAAQKDRAKDKLRQSGLDWKAIDGNHDRWFIKSAGAHIVSDIANELDNVEFLGHDQADLVIDGLTVRMVHGEDGSSYAITYRLQKFIEAMHQHADVPEVAIFAHAHKQGHVSYMGVEGLSVGALQSTTPWMMAKRNYSALGFYILELYHEDGLILEFNPRWFPADRLLKRMSA